MKSSQPQNLQIGFRAWDSDGLFPGQAKEDDGDIPATAIANEVSQTYVSIIFRFVIVSHRVVSAILFLIASIYWMIEVGELRHPETSMNPAHFGFVAWLLFFIAICLDLLYSTILSIGAIASVFLPSASSNGSSNAYLTKDMFIRMYAEMGSWADIFRYVVQMATSIIILVFAIDPMVSHNIFGNCNEVHFTPGTVPKLTGQPEKITAPSYTPTAGNWATAMPSELKQDPLKVEYSDVKRMTMKGMVFQAQHATVSHFYRVTRVCDNPDDCISVKLSNKPMNFFEGGKVDKDKHEVEMAAGTCTATASKAGLPYYASVLAIAITILVRFVVNTLGLWCIFAADRPYYIFPYTCRGQRKRMGERIQKRFEASKDPTERSVIERAANASLPLNTRLMASSKTDPQVPVVPVEGMQDADPESVQATIVPELSKTMTCGGWIEPFWYNILGSLRMHEYVAYIFYIFAFFILHTSLNVKMTDATYMPSTANNVDDYRAAVTSGASFQYANYYTTYNESCSFFYNPNDPFTAKYLPTIYTPARKWANELDKAMYPGSTLNKITEDFYAPATYSCASKNNDGKTRDTTYYQGGQFQEGCCSTNKFPEPDVNVFDPKGEQTNGMYVFALLMIIGSVFYLISSLAYAASIFGLNQAPIPQITLNSADPNLFEGGI